MRNTPDRHSSRPGRPALNLLAGGLGLALGLTLTVGAVQAAPPGAVKPRYVKCDPAQPNMPCTPDTPPPDWPQHPNATPPGVKPRYVKCDPAHPEMPCTPDAPIPTPLPPTEPTHDEANSGAKPHAVKCDPAHPEMPCTPDAVPQPPPPALEPSPQSDESDDDADDDEASDEG